MMGEVLALAGPRGSGKSTIAQRLVDHHGFERLAFSDVLREIAMLAGSERINDRHYLSDLGRILRFYEPDFLIKAMETKIERCKKKVVIEDVRFPDELVFCQTHGIFTVYLDVGKQEQLHRIQNRDGCSLEVAQTLAAMEDNHQLNRTSNWNMIISTEGDLLEIIQELVLRRPLVSPPGTLSA